jgi:glycosyltransferase involved in cell wall biosynthesis
LQALAKSLAPSVQRQIFMPGFADAALLKQLYEACYLFAMPSRAEGFGLVYLEAMSYAKPCLGSKVDAAKTVIREGVTGLLVDDPASSEELAEKISKLMANPEQARAMGEAGYELVRTNHLFSHFKERFCRLITEESQALAGKKSSGDTL